MRFFLLKRPFSCKPKTPLLYILEHFFIIKADII